MGPRVPMTVISPWSKGGWVNSQTFDHTSVGQFLEKRFGVTVPAISPWHRAVCGDLLSAFDFAAPNAPAPPLPDAKGSAARVAAAMTRPRPEPPAAPEKLFQEPGSRLSRAVPYILHAEARAEDGALAVSFRNDGAAGAVFHVYDRNRLEQIPRRYTVEAGRSLVDRWIVDGTYDLWVLGPNGFVRGFSGNGPGIEAALAYRPRQRALELQFANRGERPVGLSLHSRVYGPATARKMDVAAHGTASTRWDVSKSGNWYDLTLQGDGFVRRFAGRLETGKDGISDPAMGSAL
jgi:phospholipase C